MEALRHFDMKITVDLTFGSIHYGSYACRISGSASKKDLDSVSLHTNPLDMPSSTRQKNNYLQIWHRHSGIYSGIYNSHALNFWYVQ